MSLTVKIKGDASQFDKTMRGVKATVGGLSSKIGAIGAAAAGAAAGYVTLSKAMEFLQSASEKAAGMEDLTNQMGLLAGSMKKAKEMIKIFRDEAAKSPLSSEDYAKAAKTLMAFGMSADNSLPIMRSLADISMGNSERFGSLALAFAQTTAAGRLMGQEVLQFVNAGFNPLQQISLKTGESMATLKNRMEDGAISAQEVTQAFIAATSEGGKFYKAIELGANTTSAKIAQTKDNVDKLQIAFGTGMNEGLKVALDAVNVFLPQLEKKFESAGLILGDAMAKAVQGDAERLANIGAFIGTVIFEGFKAVYLKGLDELIAATQNKLLPQITDPLGTNRRYMQGKMMLGNELPEVEAGAASLALYMQSAIENALNSPSAMALRSAESDVRSSRIAQNLGAGFGQYTAATMAGITGTQPMSYAPPNPFNQENMSTAVTEGVVRAFTKKPLLSTFSN
jgi:tape measure domain-containing protein